MTTVEYLSFLSGLDVKLWADSNRLRYSAPKETLTLALPSRWWTGFSIQPSLLCRST